MKDTKKLIKKLECVANLISRNYVLTALDYNFAEDNEKEFKEQHGISFKEGVDAFAMVQKLLAGHIKSLKIK